MASAVLKVQTMSGGFGMGQQQLNLAAFQRSMTLLSSIVCACGKRRFSSANSS